MARGVLPPPRPLLRALATVTSPRARALRRGVVASDALSPTAFPCPDTLVPQRCRVPTTPVPQRSHVPTRPSHSAPVSRYRINMNADLTEQPEDAQPLRVSVYLCGTLLMLFLEGSKHLSGFKTPPCPASDREISVQPGVAVVWDVHFQASRGMNPRPNVSGRRWWINPLSQRLHQRASQLNGVLRTR